LLTYLVNPISLLKRERSLEVHEEEEDATLYPLPLFDISSDDFKFKVKFDSLSVLEFARTSYDETQNKMNCIFICSSDRESGVIMPSSAVQMEARSPRSLFLNGAVKRKFDDDVANGTSWQHELNQKVRTCCDCEWCGVA